MVGIFYPNCTFQTTLTTRALISHLIWYRLTQRTIIPLERTNEATDDQGIHYCYMYTTITRVTLFFGKVFNGSILPKIHYHPETYHLKWFYLSITWAAVYILPKAESNTCMQPLSILFHFLSFMWKKKKKPFNSNTRLFICSNKNRTIKSTRQKQKLSFCLLIFWQANK